MTERTDDASCEKISREEDGKCWAGSLGLERSPGPGIHCAVDLEGVRGGRRAHGKRPPQCTHLNISNQIKEATVFRKVCVRKGGWLLMIVGFGRYT